MRFSKPPDWSKSKNDGSTEKPPLATSPALVAAIVVGLLEKPLFTVEDIARRVGEKVDHMLP